MSALTLFDANAGSPRSDAPKVRRTDPATSRKAAARTKPAIVERRTLDAR